jgi:thiosulfate/3-mercaptopyruvate sulfurtransferase
LCKSYVEADELLKKVDQENIRIFDATIMFFRGESGSLESYEAAHIVGSSCLPCMDLMQEMVAFLPDDELALRLQEKAQYKRIITYCGGGIAATVNAMAHLMVGHENVVVYDGSMSEWVGERLPTEGTAVEKWETWRQK